MDPDACLVEIVSTAHTIAAGEAPTDEAFPDACLRDLLGAAVDALDRGSGPDAEWAERVLALDEWLSRGGFLPRRWARPGRGDEGE